MVCWEFEVILLEQQVAYISLFVQLMTKITLRKYKIVHGELEKIWKRYEQLCVYGYVSA